MSRFSKKPLTREIDNLINNNLHVDTSEDGSLLDLQNYSWDDLEALKKELGNSIMEFITHVKSILINPAIINNLGKHKEHFDKLINIFFSDINEFSNKIKELREQHEGKSGKLADLSEYNLYNRILIGYHTLFTELTTLITPTLSDLMLTVTEITHELEDVNKSVEEAVVLDTDEKIIN